MSEQDQGNVWLCVRSQLYPKFLSCNVSSVSGCNQTHNPHPCMSKHMWSRISCFDRVAFRFPSWYNSFQAIYKTRTYQQVVFKTKTKKEAFNCIHLCVDQWCLVETIIVVLVMLHDSKQYIRKSDPRHSMQWKKLEILLLEVRDYASKNKKCKTSLVLRVRKEQCIIYAMNQKWNDWSLNFTVPVSRCWMDKNLLGEKKENEKEGCGRRKRDQ